MELSPLHLIVILILALLILGPGKLPDVGAALGKSIREFRKATQDMQDTVAPVPVPPAAQQPAAPPPPVAPAPVAPVPVGPAPVAPAPAPPAPAPESSEPQS